MHRVQPSLYLLTSLFKNCVLRHTALQHQPFVMSKTSQWHHPIASKQLITTLFLTLPNMECTNHQFQLESEGGCKHRAKYAFLFWVLDQFSRLLESKSKSETDALFTTLHFKQWGWQHLAWQLAPFGGWMWVWIRDRALEDIIAALANHHIIADHLPFHLKYLHYLGKFHFFSRSLCSLSQIPQNSFRLFLNFFLHNQNVFRTLHSSYFSVWFKGLLHVSARCGWMWRHCLDQPWLQSRDYAHDVSPALTLACKAAQVKPAMTKATALESRVAPQLVLLSRCAVAAAASLR